MRSIRVLPGESSHTHLDEKNILPLQNELTKLTELTKPGSVSCVSAYRGRLADVSAEFGSAHGSHKTTRPASIKDRRSKQRSADSEGARIRLPLCTALRTLLMALRIGCWQRRVVASGWWHRYAVRRVENMRWGLNRGLAPMATVMSALRACGKCSRSSHRGCAVMAAAPGRGSLFTLQRVRQTATASCAAPGSPARRPCHPARRGRRRFF